jgi:hypothetical protein
MLTASHTHTAPDIIPNCEPNIGEKRQPDVGRLCPAYVEFALAQGLDAVREAVSALQPGTVCETAYAHDPGFAFNRRFWMADAAPDEAESARKRPRAESGDADKVSEASGKLPRLPHRVLTNPPRDAASRELIGASEGLVDIHIPVGAIADADGTLRVLLPNIALHADTVGGTGVSADWPGFLRRKLEEKLPGLACIPLIGCSGNINHFDVDQERDQCSYEISRTIGEGYADAILQRGLPASPRTVGSASRAASLLVAEAEFETGPREISADDMTTARKHAELYAEVTADFASRRGLLTTARRHFFAKVQGRRLRDVCHIGGPRQGHACRAEVRRRANPDHRQEHRDSLIQAGLLPRADGLCGRRARRRAAAALPAGRALHRVRDGTEV